MPAPAPPPELQSLGEALLGREAEHPTASAVFSVGLGRDGPLPTDLEFCAHCLYHDDAEAHRRLRELFAAQDLDAVPYETLLDHLCRDMPTCSPPQLHAFVGVDGKASGRAYTVYLNPAAPSW